MSDKQEYLRISDQSQHEFLNNTHALKLDEYGVIQCGIAHCRQEFTIRRKNMYKHMLLYTVKGEGWFDCGQSRIRLEPDSVIKVHAGVDNSFGIAKEEWQIAWVFLDTEKDWQNIVPAEFEYSSSIEANAIYAAILSILRSRNLPYKLNRQITTLALEQLNLLLRESIQIRQESKHFKLDKVFEEAQKQLHREWNVEQLAALYPCSVPHFFRLCSHYLAQSPMSYLTRMRMEHAASLIVSTHWSFQQIGEIVGYPVSANFSSRFKSWSSLSPREYRKRHRLAKNCRVND